MHACSVNQKSIKWPWADPFELNVIAPITTYPMSGPVWGFDGDWHDFQSLRMGI